MREFEIGQEENQITNFIFSPLDGFSILPIIRRNTYRQMNTSIFSLSLIVVLIAVLIIKDQFSVRMATVRAK